MIKQIAIVAIGANGQFSALFGSFGELHHWHPWQHFFCHSAPLLPFCPFGKLSPTHPFWPPSPCLCRELSPTSVFADPSGDSFWREGEGCLQNIKVDKNVVKVVLCPTYLTPPLVQRPLMFLSNFCRFRAANRAVSLRCGPALPPGNLARRKFPPLRIDLAHGKEEEAEEPPDRPAGACWHRKFTRLQRGHTQRYWIRGGECR